MTLPIQPIENKKMKETYEQYIKRRLEKAKEWDMFDPDGNSAVASVNRGLIKSMIMDIPNLNREIMSSVDFKELFTQIILLIQLLTIPVTYPFFLFSRAYFWKRRAHKEMRENYEKEVTNLTDHKE